MPLKGQKMSKEQRRKIGLSNKGKHTIGRPNPLKGNKLPEQWRKNICGHTPWNKGKKTGIVTIGFTGKKHKEESIKKMIHKDKENGCWKGGDIEFQHQRYKRKTYCETCGITNHLHFHIYGKKLHKSNPLQDYRNEKSYITQCQFCHKKLDSRILFYANKFGFITTA